jgi:DNA repair photolyase
MNIISASRRTDIPAFYGDWFMSRIREGAAGFINPFGGQRYTASLLPQDVLFIVFWSKNFGPFLKHLDELDALGYRFYFQFTITGNPKIFEENTPQTEQAIEVARRLTERYSPEHVVWRFDPIVFSAITTPDQIRETFTKLVKAMEGATQRCVFSYVQHYGKVRRNFESLHNEHGIIFRADPEDKGKSAHSRALEFDLTKDEKRAFACELAGIAAEHGINLYTCCGDYLISNSCGSVPLIQKAHCVDGELIARLAGGDRAGSLKIKPTRKECGCYESRDIGAYDCCPHGCRYCYANVNKEKAISNYERLAQNTGLFSMNVDVGREEFPVENPDVVRRENDVIRNAQLDFND